METTTLKRPRGGQGRFRMRRAHAVLLGVVCCAAALVLPVQSPRAEDAQDLVKAVQRRYDDTREYSADFRQTTEYRTLNRRVDGAGRVFFSKPAKMLWRYQEPTGQFVLSDGKHLYFYQPAERQVIKTALGSVFRSDLPLSFLLGIGDLERDFRPESMDSTEAGHRLKLFPRKANTGVREIHLTVDPGNHDIRQVLIEDGGGNRWTFRFENIRHGVGFDPSLFQLKVPQDVDIVEFGS